MDDRSLFDARLRVDADLGFEAPDPEVEVGDSVGPDEDASIEGPEAAEAAESASVAAYAADSAAADEGAEAADAADSAAVTGVTDAIDRAVVARRSAGADGRGRPAAAAPGPGSRANRSGLGERSTPVDWATLVEDLATSARPSFTAATTEDREMELRLCHLHLRTGSFATARIQLETLAGAGHLDRDGLLDLAEARWRTGDLSGAAQAVDTYLEAGGNAPMGHVIAAEARSALGRPGEARRHARLAVEGLEVPLDALFAGQARSAVWPQDPTMAPLTDTLFGSANAATAEQGGRIGVAAGGARGLPARGRPERADAAAWVAQGPGGVAGGGVAGGGSGYAGSRAAGSGGAVRPGSGDGTASGTASGTATGTAGAPRFPRPSSIGSEAAAAPPVGVGSPGSAGTPAGADHRSEPATEPEATNGTGLWDDEAAPVISSDAHAELERARAALSDGELHAAALRLAVVLRMSPALAPVVLDVVGPWPGPEFAMVRGDALRLVGRESAAQQAYAAASAGIVNAAPPAKPTSLLSSRSDSRLVLDSRHEPAPGPDSGADSGADSDADRPTVTSTSPSPLPIDRGDQPPS